MKYWPCLATARDGRILLPLCGKSLDLSWIRDQGRSVLGVELSAIAVESFCMENGVPARRREMADHELYETPCLTLMLGDFFRLTAAACGTIAGVYDRAALISWSPELRTAYVEHLDLLMPMGAPALVITMEYPQEQMAGPPFSVKRDEIERLYGSKYEITELERRDILAQEHRFQAKGVSSLHEVCYRLIRNR
jgi:thiopurine S-methyltransferase